MKGLLLSLALCCPLLVSADWDTVRSRSSVTFTSTKNDTIVETHKFATVRGFVLSGGKAQLTVDLLSVDTNIPIRNERMREMLFQLSPSASFNTQVDIASIEGQKADKPVEKMLSGTLSLNGNLIEMPIDALVTRLASGNVRVEGSGQLNVGAFGYADGIEKLREVAGLTMISPKVNFEFDLEFEHLENL